MFISPSQRLLLPALVASITLSGCASMQGPGSEQEALAEKDREIAELNTQVSNMQQSLTDEQRARLAAESSTAGVSTELLPPNAKPGECYARVFVPPTYKTEDVQVLKADASERIEVVPEKYEWVNEQVLVKGASERLEVVPATYEWVEEQVLVKPAGKKIVSVPAECGTEIERVLDKPEYTVWKKGAGPITRIEWRPVLCQTNMSADVVRRIQTALKNAGHNPGPIDGVMGHETMVAV